MSEEAIKAYQGKEFTVTLRSSGGTNYLWCLTSMPQGVALATVNTTVTSLQPGAPVDTTFTFFAITSGHVKVGFKLLCWSNPEEDTKELLINVNIIPHNEAGGLDGFVNYSENAASYNVPPYGYNGTATSVEKYGYPCFMEGTAVVKYGYLGCDSCPPPVKYGYVGCDSNAVASTQILYGYPPYFKYGYYGCEGCYPPVKYGYPGCDFPLPIVDYGYLGCVKYGYPYCR